VLAVVAMEVGKRGKCTLALGHMAALAGVCLTVAKRALRQARLVGLVTVEERKVSRSRNDTNVVKVVSREWAAWLRLRLPQASHVGFGGIGGTGANGTATKDFQSLSTYRPQAGNRRLTAQNHASPPAVRAVIA
jgi:hypothetical protein